MLAIRFFLIIFSPNNIRSGPGAYLPRFFHRPIKNVHQTHPSPKETCMKGNTKARTPREYVNGLPAPRRSELAELNKLIQKTTGLKPMIFYGMIGYGKFHYKYVSGREGDWVSVALASRKNYISLYACMTNNNGYIAESYKSKLPKASIGRSCVRFKRLADVDLKVLAALLKENHKGLKAKKARKEA